MAHTNLERTEDLLALDRTIERMRRMVMEHARHMPEDVPALPFDLAALRATEAVKELAAAGTSPTIKDVAAYHGLDHSTASRMVALAERQGLVERGAGCIDRRRVELTLTDKGQQVVQEIPQFRVQVLGEALQEWEDRDISLFRQMLERFRLSIDSRVRELP